MKTFVKDQLVYTQANGICKVVKNRFSAYYIPYKNYTVSSNDKPNIFLKDKNNFAIVNDYHNYNVLKLKPNDEVYILTNGRIGKFDRICSTDLEKIEVNFGPYKSYNYYDIRQHHISSVELVNSNGMQSPLMEKPNKYLPGQKLLKISNNNIYQISDDYVFVQEINNKYNNLHSFNDSNIDKLMTVDEAVALKNLDKHSFPIGANVEVKHEVKSMNGKIVSPYIEGMSNHAAIEIKNNMHKYRIYHYLHLEVIK